MGLRKRFQRAVIEKLGGDMDADGNDIQNVGSFDADTLVNNADGQAWETLKEMGYETGDVVPITTHSSDPGTDSSNFTSTSYTNLAGLVDFRAIWDLFNPGSTVKVRYYGFVGPGTDETIDTRVWNNAQSEAVVEVAGLTSSGTFDSGWVDYTPSDPSNADIVFTQAKTDPGSNTSNLNRPQVTFGIEI